MPKLKPAHIPDFKAYAKKVQTIAKTIAWQRVQGFAEDELEAFRRRIAVQDFEDFQVIYYPESGTNLSPEWLRRKEEANADPRTMIATYHYLNSMGIYTHKNRQGLGTIRVGFHPRTLARDLKGHTVDITLNQMAKVHEFGSVTAGVPKRSHWRPHLADMRERATPLRSQIARDIVRKAREAL